MSFIRPALVTRLIRWREALIWGAVLAIGAALVWRGYLRLEPLALVAGLALAAVGLALLRGALGRMRLGSAPPGPGVTVIDEARIGILGPEGGGFVDLPSLVAVEIEGAPGAADRAWVLRSEDGGRLVVPFGAAGAGALPDTLAALPGIDFGAAAEGNVATVWRRSLARTAVDCGNHGAEGNRLD